MLFWVSKRLLLFLKENKNSNKKVDTAVDVQTCVPGCFCDFGSLRLDLLTMDPEGR